MKKKEVISYLLNMLSQLVPVALGVYLGIIASNWNEQSNQSAMQTEFLQNLYQEVYFNREKVLQAAVYHSKIFHLSNELLQKYPSDTLQSSFWSLNGWNLVPGWDGLNIPTLENSVYQSGILQNTLIGLDFKTINTIAQVYNLQTEYLSWAEKLIFDEIIAIEGDASTFDAINELQSWTDMAYKGKQLEKKYDELMLLLQTNNVD